MYSYITNRYFHVTINNTPSSCQQIIAIKRLTFFPENWACSFCGRYKIYAHSVSASNYKQIQIHMTLFEKSYKLWKISLNSDKIGAIVFLKEIKHSKILTPITIYNTLIKFCNPLSVKHLGVYLDAKLTFKTHISHILKKAWRISRLLFPLMVRNSSVSSNNKRLLFTSIIRPIITYASPVWCSGC